MIQMMISRLCNSAIARTTVNSLFAHVAVLLLGFILFLQPAHACSEKSLDAIFSPERSTQRLLDIEAAMARAQAKHGVIPKSAADEITRKARADLVPQSELRAERDIVRHRMVALLNIWRKSLNEEGGRYVHFGATTVDIYDTATMLQIDQVLAELNICLTETIGTMAVMALEHRDTVMIGRTIGQHAQPISFGKKVSVWIGEFRRHQDRLGEIRQRVRRSAILKGAVGNYSGLGNKAIAVEKSFAAELGFDEPYLSDWHGTRDVIAEYALFLGLMSKSHARMGQEIFLLQSTDIAEVRESLPASAVGSSSMPHKQNPIAPEALVQSGRVIPRLAEILQDDVINLFERDNISRQSPVITEISIATGSMMRTLNKLLEGLSVNATNMRSNIDRTNGFVMSQKIVFALAAHVGKTKAEAIVKDIIYHHRTGSRSFAEALRADHRIADILSRSQIEQLLDPAKIDLESQRQIERIAAGAE
jgi:adenylosuccinate lyase